MSLTLIIGTDDPDRQSIYASQQSLLKIPLATQVRNDGPVTINIVPVKQNTPGESPVLVADFDVDDEFQVATGLADQSPTSGTFDLLFKDVSISTSSVASPSVITTASPHLLVTGNTIRIIGHVGSTPSINAGWTVTVTGASTFTIPVNVTVGGTGGTVYLTKNTLALAYNISAASLQTPVSANLVQLGYPACTVESLGLSSYRINGSTDGAVPTGIILADADQLVPMCDIPVNEVELGATDSEYRIVLQLRQAPVAYCEPATPLSGTGVVRISEQSLTASSNAIDRISYTPSQPVSGTFSIDGTATGLTKTCGVVPFNATAAQLQTILETHPYFTDNVTVTKTNGFFLIEFTNSLGPKRILSSTLANPTVITTDIPHGYVSGQVVEHSGTNSTPNTDGNQTVTVISATTYSVPVNVSTAGTAGISIPDVSPSVAVTDVDLLAAQGVSGSLYLNTENLFEYSLTQTTESFPMLFSVIRTRSTGERETILGPMAILLFKDIVDVGSMVPLSLPSYYTTTQADAIFAKKAAANTFTHGQTIDLTGSGTENALIILADAAQSNNLIEVYDATSTLNFKLDSNGALTLSTYPFLPEAGIQGTGTNDSAASGIIGQFTSSLVAVGSPVGLTTATAANVTSISLDAGDWDVEGNVNFNLTGATQTQASAGISATSATLPTDGSEVESGDVTTAITGKNGITVPRKRISIASTTTIYLVAKATFTLGTESAYGAITARRVR